MATTPAPSTDPTARDPDNGALTRQLEALAGEYGNRFLLEPAPDDALPQHGMRSRRRDAADRRGARARRHPDAQPRDVRDDVDGARGAADHRREPAPQLHRPRRVSADGGDRAALHPHARRPVPRAGRDDRRAHAGLVGGDHARRAVAEVEVARAARGGRQGHDAARTSSSAATCTSCGRSSAATSTSSRGSSRCSPTSTRSAPRTSSRTSTRTRSASPRCSARRSPATPTTSSASTTCSSASSDETGARRPAARRRRPAAASCGRSSTRDSEWDFRLEQVRSINVSGHKFGLVYPGIGWLIFRETSDLAEDLVFYENYLGKTRRDVHAELLDRLGDGARPVLQLRPLRPRRLPLHHGDDAGRTRAALAERIAGDRRVPSWSARRTTSSCRWSPSSSPGSTTTTSSTSPRSSPPSAAGWCPPTRCRPNADHVTIMRALVKLTLGHTLATTLADDIAAGLRDAGEEGRPARARPQAGEDRHRLLSDLVDTLRGAYHAADLRPGTRDFRRPVWRPVSVVRWCLGPPQRRALRAAIGATVASTWAGS